MLTKEEARARIEREISKFAIDCDVVIIEDATQSHEWGWVFFYQSLEFIETGEVSSQLAGNAPYIVNKNTGEIVETGTARPTEKYVQDYEKQLHDRAH